MSGRRSVLGKAGAAKEGKGDAGSDVKEAKEGERLSLSLSKRVLDVPLRLETASSLLFLRSERKDICQAEAAGGRGGGGGEGGGGEGGAADLPGASERVGSVSFVRAADGRYANTGRVDIRYGGRPHVAHH